MSSSRKSIVSALFLIADSVLQKMIGLISTLILARILLPEDFGIVAIAMLVIAFTEVFTQTGSAEYIVSREAIDDEALNSAWTLDIIVKVIVFAVINAVAVPTAEYYQKPELSILIHALSLITIISAFNNPGTWILAREQNYRGIFQSQVFAKVCAVCVTVSVAFIYSSYWALAFGMLTTTMMTTILSYVISNYRPKFCVTGIKKQLSFSAYMIPQELFGYVKANIDSFFISKNYNDGAFGSFHIMKYIAIIPSLNIIIPMTKPLLVEMSKKVANEEEKLYKYTLTFIAVSLIAVPISIFCYQNSEQIVGVLLGEKWLSYHEIFGAMTLLVTSLFVANHCKRILLVSSKTKFIFLYEFFAVSLVIMSVVLSLDKSLIVLIQARVFVELGLASVFLIIVSYFYLGKNSLLFMLRIAPILLCFICLGLMSSITVNFINNIELHPIFLLLLNGTLFVLLLLVSIGITFFTYYRNTAEGKQILLITVYKLFPLLKKSVNDN
jgi:O-antigen/teichoic acid export membrane protein